MNRQLDRLKWKPEKWANEAGVSPTTVSRALKDDYESITSILTVHRLAKIAGQPSPLDYLRRDDAFVLPSEEVLTALLTGIRRGILQWGPDLDEQARVKAIVFGLQEGLRLLQRFPDYLGNHNLLVSLGELASKPVPEQRPDA